MLRKKLSVAAITALLTLSLPVYAQNLSLQDLQDLPSAKKSTVQASGKTITQDHWAYKTLENVSKKYGLLIGKPEEKFDGKKALTRNEAALILVSLVGKIEQDQLQLTEVEKDRLEILKNELKTELDTLTGRVDNLETSVDSLKGNVSKLEQADSSNIKTNFGEKFKLSGMLQARYAGVIQKGVDNYAPNFRIPAAEIGVKGKLHKNIEYVANFQPSRYYDGAAKTMMSDVYASTNIIPHHTVYLGQTRVPIGYEGTMSALALETIDRSQIARNLSDARDIGIKVAGNWDYLDYYVGSYNGSRYNSKDNNTSMDIATWVNLKPLAKLPQFGSLELGSGYTVGNGNKSYDIFGLYAGYKYKRYGIKYEYAMSDGGALNAVANQKSGGWYVHNSLDLTKKLQLVARFDMFDPNKNVNNNSIAEYTLGGNYAFDKQNLKLQLNLVHVDNEAAKDSQRVVAQTQYSF